MFLFFGGIMVSSGMVIGIPGILPADQENTITGTPMDNVPDAQRPQFCESGDAKLWFHVISYSNIKKQITKVSNFQLLYQSFLLEQGPVIYK